MLNCGRCVRMWPYLALLPAISCVWAKPSSTTLQKPKTQTKKFDLQNRIVFKYGYDVFSILPNGNGKILLLKNQPLFAAFNFAGTKMVLNDYNHKFPLEIRNIHGSGSQRVLQEMWSGAYIHNPQFTPDGKALMYPVQDYPLGGLYGYIATVPLTTLKPPKSAAGLPSGLNAQLSRDGRVIAFIGGEQRASAFDAKWGVGLEVFVRRTGSPSSVQVTHNKYYDGEPSPNGNGTKIVFLRHRVLDTPSDTLDAQACDLMVVNADGSNEIRLTRDNVYREDPHFSPDGKTIVFWRGVETDKNARVGIYLINIDGSGERFLTAGQKPQWY